MERVERIMNWFGFALGLVLLMSVIMAMTSCGTSKQCNNKMVNEYRNW